MIIMDESMFFLIGMEVGIFLTLLAVYYEIIKKE